MITRENYESFFVDYLEGNLPENQIDQFLDFLNQNPDLKEELHLFEEVNLPEESVVFSAKKQLYKTPAEESTKLQTNCVAYLEGDMSADERKSFETYLAIHPELKKESDQFSKTRLIPDLAVQFQHKGKLYRKSGTTVLFNWVTRAAAVGILFWGINSVMQMQRSAPDVPNQQEIAVVAEKPVGKTIKVVPDSRENLTETETNSHQIQSENIIQEKPAELAEIKNLNNIENRESIQRDNTLMAAIAPLSPKLEVTDDVQLAFHHGSGVMQINEPNVLSVDEFLAMRVQKAGKEGIFSAQRIARLGLNIASEISGERIGYKTKDGKITSVDFESKLMAFSIPLEKK